jgi:DNA-binding IclR family transcriptional regulator
MRTRRQLATSLIKGLDVLAVIAHRDQGADIRELMTALEIPRTSVLRIVETLIRYGLVERAESRFQATPRFNDWTTSRLHQTYRNRYRQVLDKLAQSTGELVMLGALEGNHLRHLDYAQATEQVVRVDPLVSQHHALHTSAMGKLYLTQRPDLAEADAALKHREELLQVRKQGIAWNRQESQAGIVAVAMWLEPPSPLAPTLSITWPQFRFTDAKAQAAIKQARSLLSSSGQQGHAVKI